MYLYLTARTVTERNLIEAECFAVTGVIPDERGIACCEQGKIDISRAAYIKTCIKVIARAADLSELYGNLCLLYTSPSPRDRQKSRMPSSA